MKEKTAHRYGVAPGFCETFGTLVKMHLEGTHLREPEHVSHLASHWMKLLAILLFLVPLACGGQREANGSCRPG